MNMVFQSRHGATWQNTELIGMNPEQFKEVINCIQATFEIDLYSYLSNNTNLNIFRMETLSIKTKVARSFDDNDILEYL